MEFSVAIVSEQYKKEVYSALELCNLDGIIVLNGKGTADKILLQSLGLGQTKKSVFIVRYNQTENSYIYNALQKISNEHNDFNGIFFTLKTETNMESASHLLICTIVNSGYAEDIMKEARRAGAKGGTIITGKGTSNDSDMEFFGITITPEKEILLMVAEEDLVNVLVNTIKNMPLLKKSGSGVVFTLKTDS